MNGKIYPICEQTMQNYSNRVRKVSYYTLPDDVLLLIDKFSGNYRRSYRKVKQQINRIISLHTLKYLILRPRINIAFQLNEIDPPFIKWDTGKDMQRYLDLGRHQWRSFLHCFQAEAVDHLYYPSDVERMFKHIKGCRCCNMHRRNRPKNIEGNWDEQPFSRNDSTDCKCACRHYMRVLCKAYALY